MNSQKITTIDIVQQQKHYLTTFTTTTSTSTVLKLTRKMVIRGNKSLHDLIKENIQKDKCKCRQKSNSYQQLYNNSGRKRDGSLAGKQWRRHR